MEEILLLDIIGIIIFIQRKNLNLEPWVHKVRNLKNQTKKLRIYFNNHYGGKAIINALQFKEMNGLSLNDKERKILQNGEEYYNYH
jgi:uncharacterized protein YecE (DUF72 family)